MLFRALFCSHRFYVANSCNRVAGDDFVLECKKCGYMKITKELVLDGR